MISLKTPIGRRALEFRAAILVFVLLLTGSISRADTCGYKWTCTSSACGAALGAMSGTAVESGVTLEACERVREKQSYIKSEPCTCPAGEATAGAVSTGSLTGDALNLGANLWIINNVKNPYTAVFAQKFSQGFLTALFSNNNSNSEAQRQQQLANEAVQREQQEAAERARIAEQQRIDAMFARLNSQLKLSGSAIQLALKTGGPMEDLPMKLSNSGPDNGLRLKLGDSPTNGSGIQGLPGIYVGGPVDTADSSGELKLKLGDAPAPAPATTQPIPSVGIPGLPGLNLNNVEPSQAAQLADAATALTGPERGVVEDAALLAAQKNPAITAPSDDPFVADYQKEAQVYDGAMQQQQQALQKASEAEGHVQADRAAIDYASKVVQSPDATEAQKQAFRQMQSAAHSDEDAAVAARQMFEQTDVHLSIVRDRASDALASLAPPPTNLGASTSSASPAAASGPGGHAAASPQVVASSPVRVLSMSEKPQILASPPTGGKPYVLSVSECVASYSPKGDVPSLDELQKKVDATMTAMEQIAKSQENSNELTEDWNKKLRDAHQDIVNNVSDAALDGLLDLSMKSLEKDKELYHEALEASMKESQQLRWEHQATAGFGEPNAIVEGKIADYLKRAKAQLGQRQVIEDDMAGVEKAQSALEKYQTRRDFRNWITDNELIPCKFANDGKINCNDFKENNGFNQFRKGDLNTQLDLLKQVIKFGMQNSHAFKALSYGSLIGETWDITSFVIDTAYDGLAIAYSKQRLEQVSQNDVQLNKAREVLGARIDRLNAEIGCYQKTNPTMAEDVR